ncbi:MAG: 30S ribosomal protein S3 [Planctomycetota bacterium]|jgi:small subunit ribosomal protein S3
MGQKVSPIGFRTGITIGWKSRWFAPKSNYGEFLVEDERIRRFIDSRLNRQPPYAAISSIEIERTREEVKVSLRTARPGVVIGAKGAEVERLKSELEELTDRRVNINIIEVKNPDLDAQLISEAIAEQLRRRASFRRTIKQRAEGAMQAGAKGVKIQISGRLGGAEMSRSETVIMGSIPLHTLEADVDYGFTPCFTTYGTIGVKAWVYRGMFGEAGDEEDEAADAAKTRARRRRERRGRSRATRAEARAPEGPAEQAQPPAEKASEETQESEPQAAGQTPESAEQPAETEPEATESGSES